MASSSSSSPDAPGSPGAEAAARAPEAPASEETRPTPERTLPDGTEQNQRKVNPQTAQDEQPPGQGSSRWWPSLPGFESALVVGGLAIFLVLLYEMEVPPEPGSFLNPPLVALAGAVLLWPVRHVKAVRAILASGAVLLLLWFVNAVSTVLVPFVVVYLLAYLLNPAVRTLRGWGVPRWAGALGLTTLAVGMLVAVGFIVVPSVVAQIETLSERVLATVDSLRNWLAASAILDTLEQRGLIEKQALLAQVTTMVQEQASRLPRTAQRVLESLGSLLGVVTTLALIPVLLFYTLKDFPRIRDALVGLFPTTNGRRDYLLEAGGIVGNYLRGQLLISLIAAFNISVALGLFAVPFWLLIGLVGGFFNFIPNLGAILTMVLGVLLAFIFGGWVKVLVVVAVLLAQALLEQSVLTPNILGYQVGMHPVLVLLSLFVFGAMLGFFGLLIAVPATAILATAYRAYREELTLDLSTYAK